MPKKVFQRTITVKGKRPANATPEEARRLRKKMSAIQIAKAWGISRSMVYVILKQK